MSPIYSASMQTKRQPTRHFGGSIATGMAISLMISSHGMSKNFSTATTLKRLATGCLSAHSDQGLSHFERGCVKSEREDSQRASLKRGLSFFMHPPRHLAQTLAK